MNTRSRAKQTDATRVPSSVAVSTGDAVSEVVDPVFPVRRTTRSSSKTETKIVPEQKLKKVPANPKVKKKVPVREQPVTTDDERYEDAEDPDVDSDPEIESEDTTLRSDDEFQLEMDKLKQRMTELETLRVKQQSRKRTEVPREFALGSNQEPSLSMKPMNPAEGEMLGTFDGRTDLDAFLVRFRACSRNFKWTETEKVFYLMNALTDRAEPIVKEVGSDGTLEDVMKLLQSRFGNRCKQEKFRNKLKNRRRGPDESLQDFYLDLCRLRANAYDNDPNEKFPEIFFRDIFVDALGDRELRRAILIQEPVTMEAAYNVAMKLEAIDAYQTPFRDGIRDKQKVRKLDQEFGDPVEFLKVTETQTQVVGNKRLAELEEFVRAQNAVINEMRQINESLRYESSQTIPRPMQNPGFEEFSDQTYGGGTVNNYRDSSVPSRTVEDDRSAGPSQRRRCFNCDGYGHFSRYCKKPRRRDENLTSPRNGGSRSEKNPARRCGSVPGTVEDNNLSSKVRREAHLEVKLGDKRILALLDSGCEQSVIGRNLIRHVPLEPTRQKLSTADGTEIPLLGEITIEFSVFGFHTECRVVVSDVITELILGIDWLQKNQCVWNFGSNLFAINGHHGRLRCKKTSHAVRRILVSDEIVIPGWHTLEVPVLITRETLRNANTSWGMTSKVKDLDLMVASAIFKDEDVRSICQVVNMSDLPKRLKKGSELGEAEPVELMELDKQSESASRVSEGDGVPLDLRKIVGSKSSCGTEEFKNSSVPVPRCEMEPGSTDFIKEMFDKIAIDLTDEQKKQVEELLQEYKEVFSTSEFDLGRTNLVKHTIDTGTNRPFKQALRRHPMAYLPIIDEHVDKMLANDICEPSYGPWASNVVLVKKSDGTLRFCIDYRQLNNLTVKDSYPLPRIDTCFDALGDAKFFSTLDLRQGYWQVENDPETADKTTFITRKGAFKFKVLPFGLSNAPAVFQRLMNLVMRSLTWEACLVFLDDIVVMSTTFEQHLERLRAVFSRLKSANLKLKPSKCKLFQLKVKFLGSIVSANGIEPDPDKLKAIDEWPVPKNLTELRAFVGLASYYRRHVEGFSDLAKPLSELTRKNQPFIWGPDQQQAFEILKDRLMNYPVLAPPLPEGRYIIDTDASDFAMGAVLQQEQNGTVRVISYASKTFDAAERQYCTTRKELAAVIYALKTFRHYILGVEKFLLRTDHGALTSLFRVPVPIQQQARYLNFLADYNFEIQHRAGINHGNSDGLSRRPCGDKKCTRDDCTPVPGYARKFQAKKNPAKKNPIVGPLRSGKPYQKGTLRTDGVPTSQTRNPVPTEPVPEEPKVTTTAENEKLDIPWETIQAAQEADPTLLKIRELMWNPDPPQDVNEFGIDVVHLWSQRKSLEIINGVLHRNYETPDGLIEHRQILVPEPLRKRFLYWVHGDPTSGHFGVQKTTAKLQHYAYWSGWRRDVELFVRRCDICCRYRKGPTRPQGAMRNGVGLAPFQKFHIDLTGPHRRSAGGHVYLLTGICCFTKYLVVVPLRDKTALTVANALLKHVYLIYGACELQVHDNGSEFVNSILQHLSRMMGIQDLRSTAYRPVANAAIERTHRTINAVFAKTIKEHQRDWHEQAKYVCFAYNTAKHSSTTFSPFYLVFLREPRVGIDLFPRQIGTSISGFRRICRNSS